MRSAAIILLASTCLFGCDSSAEKKDAPKEEIVAEASKDEAKTEASKDETKPEAGKEDTKKVAMAGMEKSAGEKTTLADLVKPGDAKVGDKTWCLTSGEVFTVAADSAKAQYEGKTYYFCCGGCDEQFLENPTKMLATPPDLGA